MKKFNQSIWKNADKDRCFLLLDDLPLEDGDYLIRTSTGREQSVQLQQLCQYEISQEEATQWLKNELTGVIGQFGKNLNKRSDDRKNRYPGKLAELYREKTDGGSEAELASLLNRLSDTSEAIPERMKTRMREIADRLNNPDDDDKA